MRILRYSYFFYNIWPFKAYFEMKSWHRTYKIGLVWHKNDFFKFPSMITIGNFFFELGDFLFWPWPFTYIVQNKKSERPKLWTVGCWRMKWTKNINLLRGGNETLSFVQVSFYILQPLKFELLRNWIFWKISKYIKKKSLSKILKDKLSEWKQKNTV